jgi:DNA-binding winged helix-turn-helix (wHTH) protein
MTTGDTVESTPIFEHSADKWGLASDPFEARLLAFVQTLGTGHQRRELERGRVIYSTGDRDRKLYLLEEGTAKISVSTHAEPSWLLELHSAPAILGVSACVIAARVDTAVAQTGVSLREIPVPGFMKAIETEGLGSAFVAYLAAREAQQQRVLDQYAKSQASSGTYAVAPGSLYHDPLELDLVNQTLVVHGQAIATTRYQFMMLAHMVANAGRAISAEEFRLQLFRSQHDRSSSNVRRQIHALRQLLENAHSGLAEIIENVPGVGYGVGIRRKIAG